MNGGVVRKSARVRQNPANAFVAGAFDAGEIARRGCWLSRPGVRRALDLLASMVSIVFVLSLAIRTAEFVFYHLLSLVDHVSGLPRDMMVPEAMLLYRENIALKAQLEALERHLVRVETKRKRVSLGVRTAQVFAYGLIRYPFGSEPGPPSTFMRGQRHLRCNHVALQRPVRHLPHR